VKTRTARIVITVVALFAGLTTLVALVTPAEATTTVVGTAASCNTKCVPVITHTVKPPKCGSSTFAVTVSAGAGKQSTNVELDAYPAVVLKRETLRPNQSFTMNVSVAVGATMRLFIVQDGREVSHFAIKAPSKQKCGKK